MKEADILYTVKPSLIHSDYFVSCWLLLISCILYYNFSADDQQTVITNESRTCKCSYFFVDPFFLVFTMQRLMFCDLAPCSNPHFHRTSVQHIKAL